MARAAQTHKWLSYSTYEQDEPEIRHLLAAGFVLNESEYTMQLDFNGPPPESPIPDGFRLVNYAAQPTLRPYIEIKFEVFPKQSDEEEDDIDADVLYWQKDIETDRTFDATCWWLAYYGSELAGAIMTDTWSYRSDDIAWIYNFGVREKFRRRGVGLALITRAMSACYRRGNIGVGLETESTKPAAVRHYRRLGMRVVQQFDIYLKRLDADTERVPVLATERVLG